MKNVKGAIDHLKTHQKYPATRKELVAECDNLSDFDEEDKNWFMENLHEATYENAEEVMAALGLKEEEADKMTM
ncbi:MAG: hypothetical protein US53_C0066G0007 [Candidatus Woesebacteria bacterium GW2011_GWA1_37_7]|uniref:DUF2795 domain-containing protein n=2 Tax=Candidatus Woeseibacteriota TaxID=1752722 RepID=A0A0G0GYJ0_9BACT|nr:MAG: hypothetical protein US53_C0066G0007 [Candidatus Woesebacteria bacterium GW2011_GWA1_37_7]OGM19193.1 MAG: hypothetical protein A2685_03285 [Candidatus Woesebacteria bacterium RIFCSPHIGHO2_01_FULL_37_10]